jgi:hypothetical protein
MGIFHRIRAEHHVDDRLNPVLLYWYPPAAQFREGEPTPDAIVPQGSYGVEYRRAEKELLRLSNGRPPALLIDTVS